MTLGFNANGRVHTYDGKPIKHFLISTMIQLRGAIARAVVLC